MDGWSDVPTDRRMNGWTDGHYDRRTDARTDGQTQPLAEMLSLKTVLGNTILVWTMEVTQLNVQQENEDWKRSEAKKDSYSFNENPREMCPATEAKKRQNKKKNANPQPDIFRRKSLRHSHRHMNTHHFKKRRDLRTPSGSPKP